MQQNGELKLLAEAQRMGKARDKCSAGREKDRIEIEHSWVRVAKAKPPTRLSQGLGIFLHRASLAAKSRES